MADLFENLFPGGGGLWVGTIILVVVMLALCGLFYIGTRHYATQNLQGQGNESEVVKRTKLIFQLGSGIVIVIFLFLVLGLLVSG